MKNLKRLLSVILAVALIAIACWQTLGVSAAATNKFEISTGDPYNAVESTDTEYNFVVKFDVNQEYGFVGGEFTIDIPDKLKLQEIDAKYAFALDDVTPISTGLVSIAIKDNKVRFIVDDAKQSCGSIIFSVKLGIVAPLTEGVAYKVILAVENGAFKDIYSQNEEIKFSTLNNTINLHIHDQNGAGLTCSVCNKHIDKYTPDKPNKPSLQSKTDTTIILKPIDGYEYKMGDGDWQSSNVFIGLTPDKSYTFYQRVAETDQNNASESSDGFTVITKSLADAGHILIHIDEIPATCTTVGQKAHDKCTECGNTYINNNVVTDLVIPKTAHNLIKYNGKEPTCTQSGWKAYEECKDCNYTTYESLPATGHNMVVSEKNPTCTQSGWSGYKCTKCDYTTYNEIAALGHNKVSVAEVLPQTDINGTKAHDKCTVCDSLFIGGVEVTKNDLIIPAYKWVKSPKGWWYDYSDGTYAIGWAKIDGVWYHFNASGYMQTGWQKIKNVWYYFLPSGAMVTNWQKISKVWYYFDTNGAMQIGWEKIDNVWYYFDTSGAMQTGWKKISNIWYYFDSSGAMRTGWLKSGGIWYYLKSSGAMVTGTQTIGRKVYKFNSSGACLNP